MERPLQVEEAESNPAQEELEHDPTFHILESGEAIEVDVEELLVRGVRQEGAQTIDKPVRAEAAKGGLQTFGVRCSRCSDPLNRQRRLPAR